jgi:hypothetical protein
MRTGFLWSLLNLAGGGIKQHIVIQTPPTVQNHRAFLDEIFLQGADPDYQTRKLIRFSNDFHQEPGMTTVPLRSIYEAREDCFPQFHRLTRSHFLQFSRSMYASVMGYAEFCGMEDKLAHIMGSYLEDRRNHWLIMMDDPFLMGSVRGYGSKTSMVDNSVWITMETTSFNDMLLMDLGQEQSSHV